MLSLSELQRAVRIIQKKLSGTTLRRVVQPEALKLVLTFESREDKRHLLLTGNAENARLCLTERPESIPSSNSFYEYVRAHLIGSIPTGIEAAADDRQASLKLQSGEGAFTLILSILGGRSNIYLLDAEGKLLHSMRPLEETRSELKIGEAWTNPKGMVPSAGRDRWEDVPDDAYLETIDKAYLQLELKSKADLSARRIQQALKKERAFLDRKSTNLQEDLGEAKQAETFGHRGELLKNALHTIRHGDRQVTVTDYETGESFEIPLDPKLSPAANLEAYFVRYQKQMRGASAIEQQLKDLETSRAELDSIEQALEKSLRKDPPDLPALESLESQPNVRRLIHRYAPKQKPAPPVPQPSKKKDVPARLLPKRYRTQDGLEIWVGRNDEGNDYLTTRLARGNDLFFHLEGYPGSHVILRTEGRDDAPPGSLLDACELAVHYSKLKNSSHADVHVAPIKNVKKPKGAKPGLVYVRSGKTIHLKRDAKRLQNILASRQEA
jgi:predicted ribosome quality control (RQC) complex YloA/Tae2 family protein